jgi:hypothetical protein
MRRAYRTLLRLYPADYRAMFAAEMERAFDQLADERSVLTESIGVIAGATAEWIAKWTTDPVVRGRTLPGIRMMRPPGITREVWFRSDQCS